MEKKLYFWLTIFFVGIGIWFYSSIKIGIDYDRHPRLRNPITGARIDPKELLRLTSKVFNYSALWYVNETNSEERLHDLIYWQNLESYYNLDQSYTNKDDLIKSGWPVANQTKCGHQLSWIQTQLDSHQNYTFLKGEFGHQLTTYMDGFGRAEAGLYSGMVNWMGSYKQCMRASLDDGRIKTRYCIGRMRAKWWPKNITVYPVDSIRLGLCLPETCDTLSFDQYQPDIERLAKKQLLKFYQDGYDLVSMFCLPDERSPLRQLPTSGRIYIYVMVSWFALVVFATIYYEVYYREKKSLTYSKIVTLENGTNKVGTKGSQLILNNQLQQLESPSDQSRLKKVCEALSLRCSLKSFKTKLFRVNYGAGERVRANLGILDSFRSAMTALIVIGHCGMLNQNFSKSITNKLETSQYPLSIWGVCITILVDTFFFIFGILSTYNIMRKFKPHQLGNWLIWLAINIRIFIRITPIYMVIFWFSRSIIPYTDSGPWWDYGVDIQTPKGLCLADPWWLSIPVFAAFRRLNMSLCIPTSWFIVSYLQIATFLPLVTYIIYTLPKHLYRMLFVGLMATISSLYVMNQLYHSNTVPLEYYTKLGTVLVDYMDKFEISGHLVSIGRVGSVCVGCYVGYLIRRYEEGSIQDWPIWLSHKMSPLLAFLGMLIMSLFPVYNHYIYLKEGKYLQMGEFLTATMVRGLLWPFLNAILFISLSTSLNHTAAARLLSHSFWYLFNKLGLVIYLAHYEVIYILMTSYEQAPPYGLLRETFKYWGSVLFYVIMIAIFLHLFVEVPAEKLISSIDSYLLAPKPSVNQRKQVAVNCQECELEKVEPNQVQVQ